MFAAGFFIEVWPHYSRFPDASAPFFLIPPPPVIVELVQLGCVLRSIVWAVWRERVVDSPESRRPSLSARHVTASSDMRLAGAAASRRTQPSVGKEVERASERVEVNS